jgi:hypothetical protein
VAAASRTKKDWQKAGTRVTIRKSLSSWEKTTFSHPAAASVKTMFLLVGGEEVVGGGASRVSEAVRGLAIGVWISAAAHLGADVDLAEGENVARPVNPLWRSFVKKTFLQTG